MLCDIDSGESKPLSSMFSNLCAHPNQLGSYRKHDLSVPNSEFLNHRPGGSPTPSNQYELDRAQVLGKLAQYMRPVLGSIYNNQGHHSLSLKVRPKFNKGSEYVEESHLMGERLSSGICAIGVEAWLMRLYTHLSSHALGLPYSVSMLSHKAERRNQYENSKQQWP